MPYLGPLLDAGMATILYFEIREGIRSVTDPDFYYPHEDPDIESGKIWLGPADDTILRKRGGYDQAANEHIAVYEFLTAGNAEKAAAAMERHLISTESRFLKGLENNGA